MSKKQYFPINLSLTGEPVVVYGGGEVAERKIRSLLGFNAQVTVISPAINLKTKEWVDLGCIAYEEKSYTPGDIPHYRLVFAATDDASVNHQIAAEAREYGILVNVADDPDYCDFIVPALVKRGPLTVALSTSGVSPALSRRLREKLQTQIGSEYEELLLLLENLRTKLQEEGRLNAHERGEKLLAFTKMDLPPLFREHRWDELDRLLRDIFGYSWEALKPKELG